MGSDTSTLRQKLRPYGDEGAPYGRALWFYIMQAKAASRFVQSAVQEGDDLCAGAGCVGREGRCGRALRYAALGCPDDGIAAEGVGSNVEEGDRAAYRGRARRTVQEGDDLRTGAGGVGRKRRRGRTLRDTGTHRPLYSVIKDIRGLYVREAEGSTGLRTAGSPPEEHNDLVARAARVWRKRRCARALCDAGAHRPLHRIIAEHIGRYIVEHRQRRVGLTVGIEHTADCALAAGEAVPACFSELALFNNVSAARTDRIAAVAAIGAG